MMPDIFEQQRRQLAFSEDYFRPAEPPERYQYDEKEEDSDQWMS